MKNPKLISLLIIALFLLSFLSVIGFASAATVQLTLTAQTGGSASWVVTTPPIPSYGGVGTFGFTVGVTATFNAIPTNGYDFIGWYLYTTSNNVNFAQSMSPQISFAISATPIRIEAHFRVSTTQYYQVSESHDFNTFITPVGTSTINSGNSVTYYYHAYTGYQINSVVVDGSNVAITGSYTFSNIHANHVINVQSGLIPQSNILITFANMTGGGLGWTNYGQGPLPPLNPTMGGAGTFGFPVGENVRVQAFPDSIHGYIFANMTIVSDSGTTSTDSTIYDVTVSTAFSITAYFNYVPSTNYTVIVSSSGGGQLTWIDNTTMATGSNGSITFGVGDTVTFNAAAYNNYYFKGIYSTWGLLNNGVSINQQVVLIIMENFSISAAFSTSNLDYTVQVNFSPAPLNVVIDNTTTFILEQGVTYTATVYVTSHFTSSVYGYYNISISTPSYTIATIEDVGQQVLNLFGLNAYNIDNYWYAFFQIMQAAYSAGGSYSQVVTNQQFGAGNFQFVMQTDAIYNQTLFQGVELSIFSQLDYMNFNSPIYTITWVTPAQAESYATPTPSPTATPIDIVTSTTNIVWNDTARLIYGILTLVGLALGLALILRRDHASIEGLLVGLALGMIINILAFAWAIWFVVVIIIAMVVLIVKRM